VWWVLPFFCLAVIGLILSTIAHSAALFELPQPLGEWTWLLHVGIFVVWIPAILTGSRRASNRGAGGDIELFRTCPKWMESLVTWCFVYAIINFITFIPNAPPKGQANGPNAPPIVFRGFSGHWMLFYSAAMAMLYSAMVRRRRTWYPLCPNGHAAPRGAPYCPVCGEHVGEPVDASEESPGLRDVGRAEISGPPAASND
jgi:hypothetical protein